MISAAALLLLAGITLPALITPLWLWRPLRGAAALLTIVAPLPALAAALLVPTATTAGLPDVFTGIAYGMDPIGRGFLLLTTLLWTAGTWYAHGYIRHDADRPVFFGFLLLAMCGNFGVAVAADALGFYLHFALMTFAAYGLIVHERTGSAVRAGRIYIAMAVLGEAALLAALMLLGAKSPTLRFDAIAEMYMLLERPALVAALFATGFAVKAGVVPLHLWLPLAHPVAPTPASALLSGAMIKAGLIGWLRLLPLGTLELPGLGAALVAAGLVSALLAVALGVVQPLPKIVLAYSSISQMGYMAVAVGAALIVPAVAGAAVLAATIYAVHHGLAKAALFLAVGLAGGDARTRRRVMLISALPALALAGAPLTSGALAKGVLKTGIADLPAAWPLVLDTLLTLAAVGTTLIMARFLAVLRPPAEPHGARGVLYASWLAIVALSAAGALWLPLAFRPPDGLDLPGPFYGIARAFWPVALGALMAAGVWRFRVRMAYLDRVRMPAGDLIVGLERGAAAIRVAPWRLSTVPLRRFAALPRSAGGYLAGIGGRIAARETALGTGPLLGVLLALIAIVMAAALLLSNAP
jgi:formate hydrogenlyase subunit 3/multisubunit Na+/H+ antiporter MnhD subunit